MKKILFILSVAALALVSCNKEPGAGNGSDGTRFIEFAELGGLSMSVDTRATPVTIDGGSGSQALGSFYVTASKGSGTSLQNEFQNVSFSKQGSGSSAYWASDRVWPSSNPNYHFYASNVEMSGSGTNNSNVTVQVGTSGSATINTDIIVAYMASPTYKTRNQLNFSHIFARVGNVTLSAPTGYTISNLRVTLSPILTGTYTLSSGTNGSWTNRGNASGTSYLVGSANGYSSIGTAGGSVTQSNDIWLVPNTYTLTATFVLQKGSTFTSSQITRSVSNISLQQGSINSISGSLTVGSDGATDLDFTVQIQPWSDNSITGVNF